MIFVSPPYPALLNHGTTSGEDLVSACVKISTKNRVTVCKYRKKRRKTFLVES